MGYEKIVIYATGGIAEHAARLTETGRWSSKLGLQGEDIEHDSVEVVAGGVYGTELVFLKRKRTTS